MFFNVYYGKLTLEDNYSMPVAMRRWWVDKTLAEMEKAKEAQEESLSNM